MVQLGPLVVSHCFSVARAGAVQCAVLSCLQLQGCRCLQVSGGGGVGTTGLDSGPTLTGPMWAAGKAEESGISASLRAQARSIIPHRSPVISASRHLGCVSHFTEEDTEVIATE